RFGDEVTHEALVRRKVAEHPAAAVKEHEAGERAAHAERSDDHQLDRLAVAGDRADADVGLVQFDRHARLRRDEDTARLGRRHLLHRLATGRRERLEKFLDAPLDPIASRPSVRQLRLLLAEASIVLEGEYAVAAEKSLQLPVSMSRLAPVRSQV